MQSKIFDLGLVNFGYAWQFQKGIHAQVKMSSIPAALILCRHYPVVTAGRLANKQNLLVSLADLNSAGVKYFELERGGDMTYHGPGQLTVYPVINLHDFRCDLHWYLRQLEKIIIKCLADFGVVGQRIKGFTGVWVNDKKIASIGIAVKNWITWHGISVNIKSDDLDNFHLIRPCGMDIEMTSLESELKSNIEIESVKENIIHNFKDTISLQEEEALR